MSSVGQHIRRNTRALLLSWFIGQFVQLVRLPIFWSFIGPEGVAMWLLAFQVMGYIAFYNIGFDNAYLKYTAEFNAKKDYERLSQIVSTGVAIALFFGGAIFFALFFAAEWITDVMMNIDTSAVRTSEFQYIIVVIAATNWYKMVMGVHRSMLSGAQRLDIIMWIGIVLTPLELSCMVGAMYMGYGVKTLITIYAIFMTVPALITRQINKRVLPEVRVNPFLARRDCIRPLFSLGGRMQVLGFIAVFVNTLDTLVMNKFYGLEFTGSYGTARQLSQRVMGFAGQGLGALVPASAHLHGSEDYAKLTQLYKSASRVGLLVAGFLFAFVGVNADYFLMVFMDADNYTTIALQFLTFMCVARVFHTLTGAGSTMLRGAGKPGQEIAYQSLTGIGFAITFTIAQIYLATKTFDNFALPVTSIQDLQMKWQTGLGTASDYTLLLLALPLSLSLASILFTLIANMYFKVPLWTPIGKGLIPATLALVLAMGLRVGWEAIPVSVFSVLPFEWGFSRWPSIVSIFCQGTVYTGLFALIALTLPGLDPEEKRQVIKLLPVGKRIAEKFVR